MSIRRHSRNIKRIGEIAQAAISHGLGYWVSKAGLRVRVPAGEKGEKPPPVEILAKRLRSLLEDLGPTFVKVGQLLSVRPDLIPPEVVFELENLLDETAPISFETVREEVERSLGRSLENVFERFDQEPVASASIGQVHRAVLRDGGHDVAVKVQRPGIQSKIEADLDIIAAIASMAKERVEVVDLPSVVREFKESLFRELDYRIEARHIDRFRFNFRDDELVRIPLVHWKYSGKKLLVLEYIEGWKLSELAEPEDLGIDTFALAKHGAEAFMKQVLEDGFFHGDLHPANLLITPEGRIAYLDFGIVGTIPESDGEAIAHMLLAIIRRDIDEVIVQTRLLGVDVTVDKIDNLRVGLKDAVDRYSGKKLGELKIDVIGREFLSLIYLNHIRLPRNYALLAKALITVEGTAKKLYPDINILEIAQPYVVELIGRKYGREMTAEALYEEIKATLRYLAELPRLTHEIISRARAGELRVRVEQPEFETLRRTVDSAANRLIMALLVSAIVISTTVLYATSSAPDALQISLVAIGGAIALALLYATWRRRG